MVHKRKNHINTAVTPGNTLLRNIKQCVKNQTNVDGGATLVIEDGGRSILAGLQRRDPHKPQGCPYQQKCMIEDQGDCSASSVCYSCVCAPCMQKSESIKEAIRNTSDPETKARLNAELQKVQTTYIGTTGRSIHARAMEHAAAVRTKSTRSALAKHQVQHHRHDPPDIAIKMISKHRSVLNRLIRRRVECLPC